ncbi:MAG: thiamine phosphate synthase [Rhodospirillaceae bacterium]|nr:thiamine phosphate synthase [Rhodospirillaceae bacterium]
MNPTLTKAAANLKRRAGATVHSLPAIWLMSDDNRLTDPATAAATLPRGAAVIFRHYAAPDRKALAMRLAGICRRRGLKLIIAGDWRLAAASGAAGLHLAEHAARRGPEAGARLWLKRKWLTLAAHGPVSLRRAGHFNAAAVLLSPVFTTASHPDLPPLGHVRVASMTRTTRTPVMALGGITARNIARLRHSGCAGIAGIGFALKAERK